MSRAYRVGFVQTAPPAQPSVQPPARDRTYLILIGLGVLLALLAAFVLLLFRRPTGSASKEQKTASQNKETPEPTLALACGNCERKLRVRQSLAGKSVKCPQCGAKVSMPKLSASDTT